METQTAVDDSQLVEKLRAGHRDILKEIRKVIIAQDDVITQVMISMMVGAHSMITGVPGLAKTLLIKTLAQTLGLDFKRIQFTPDEINRTPPKTQAALLEAMEELQVTVQGITYPMASPFFVLATQNPIELEGTYPLPEAQLDRFMFNIIIDYLEKDDEHRMVTVTTQPQQIQLEQTLTGQDIVEYQKLVRRVPVPESVSRYAVALVRASRPGANGGFDFTKEFVNWGASPRAAQYLLLAGKARALLSGRFNVSIEDIQALAYPVLRHRILTNFHAESQRITKEEIIRRLLESVPEPKSGLGT
jgi:MoxR-like ATPase